MKDPNKKFVFVTWSGGIDSTAVIAQCLAHGYTVQPVTLLFGGTLLQKREHQARMVLQDWFTANYPDLYRDCALVDGKWLNTYFEVGKVAQMSVPRRNRLILDYMMANFVLPSDGYYLGMGTYIGSDTGVVEHVPAHDADTRYLQAYLLQEYGYEYRLITCDTFGEARYKGDRVRQLVDVVGPKIALHTSNCGKNILVPCGNCYNCAERHVAFEEVLGRGFDSTVYQRSPSNWLWYNSYVKQHNGELVDKVTWAEANT